MRLFIDALLSPAGKGLTSWLLFVMSNCEVVTFPLVSWVRCGARLYRFLIFALFLTFMQSIIRLGERLQKVFGLLGLNSGCHYKNISHRLIKGNTFLKKSSSLKP